MCLHFKNVAISVLDNYAFGWGGYRFKVSCINKNACTFMLFTKAFSFAELFSTALALNFLLPDLLLNLDLYCREII